MYFKQYAMAALSLILMFVSLFAEAKQPPNIVHILVDDVGYDDLGVFGSKDIKTPHLDSLAQQGVAFSNFYAPHPTCTPTRAAILTGRLAPRVNNAKGIGILWPNAKTGLEPELETSVATLLRDAGYKTALIGKWHLGDKRKYLPPNHGFDRYLGLPYPNDHGPERNGNKGTAELDKIPLMEGLEVKRRLENYELAEMPSLFTRESAKFIRASVKAGKPFYLQYSNIETHTPWFVPLGFNGYSEAGEYGDAVEYMDRSVGVIIDQLERLKIRDNTLVIFSSDNGPLVHEYPELRTIYGKYADVDVDRANKRVLHEGKYQARYEGGPKVAFIMSWPGVIPQGEWREHIVDGTDIFTTMLTAAGVEVPSRQTIDGRDILPVAKDNNHKGVRNVFYSFSGDGMLMGLRVDDWKLAVPHRKTWAISALTTPQLFNLKDDPKEQSDIAGKHPDIKEALLKLAAEAKDNIKHGRPLQQWVTL